MALCICVSDIGMPSRLYNTAMQAACAARPVCVACAVCTVWAWVVCTAPYKTSYTVGMFTLRTCQFV